LVRTVGKGFSLPFMLWATPPWKSRPVTFFLTPSVEDELWLFPVPPPLSFPLRKLFPDPRFHPPPLPPSTPFCPPLFCCKGCPSSFSIWGEPCPYTPRVVHHSLSVQTNMIPVVVLRHPPPSPGILLSLFLFPIGITPLPMTTFFSLFYVLFTLQTVAPLPQTNPPFSSFFDLLLVNSPSVFHKPPLGAFWRVLESVFLFNLSSPMHKPFGFPHQTPLPFPPFPPFWGALPPWTLQNILNFSYSLLYQALFSSTTVFFFLKSLAQ